METGLLILDTLMVVILVIAVYRHERKPSGEGSLGLFSYKKSRVAAPARPERQGDDRA